MTQIQKCEADMTKKMAEMQQRVLTKEKELAQVKQLFVEKLKILESSFADLGEMVPQIQKENKLQKYISDETTDQTVQELTSENS